MHRHTLTRMTQCGHLYKASVQLMRVPFSSINTPISFPIIALFIHYSGFLESFYSNIYMGHFFSSFLAQRSHESSFPCAHFLKQIYPIAILLHILSLLIFKCNTFLIYCSLFLSLYSLHIFVHTQNVHFVHCYSSYQ